MISFNNLGYMGRLGNQMFQYAALKGIALHHGYEYSIPHNNSLKEYFKVPLTKENQNQVNISTNKYEFDEKFFNYCPDNVDLVGYFQTEKYFKHIDKEIRQDFRFYDRIENICFDYFNSIFKNQKVISLHIRRTDYLKDSNFECLSLEYYYEALNLLPDVHVLVFSDDPSWCREHFVGSKFTISLTQNPGFDLCLMSFCHYHIIANSSFSWWGSWLSQSQKTIAPKKWFCGQFCEWDTRDLYLPDWITI